MKILTKQICSVRSGSIRPDSSDGSDGSDGTDSSKQRIRRSTLTFAAVGLAIALTACGGNPAADQTSAQTSTQPSAQSSSNASTEAVQTPANSPSAANTLFVKDGIAIAGADPVAYFTEKAYVPGSADYTYDWQGATWQFSNAENRDLFAKNPEQYAPEYGGFCAWAVAAKNSLVPVDPNAWSVVDGKLYLNANQKVKESWLKDVPGFITKANENWPGLSQS